MTRYERLAGRIGRAFSLSWINTVWGPEAASPVRRRTTTLTSMNWMTNFLPFRYTTWDSKSNKSWIFKSRQNGWKYFHFHLYLHHSLPLLLLLLLLSESFKWIWNERSSSISRALNSDRTFKGKRKVHSLDRWIKLIKTCSQLLLLLLPLFQTDHLLVVFVSS